MKRILISLGLLLLAPGALIAQTPGDWVLARWRGGDFWFPGIVEIRSATTITVAYDDGTREKLPLDLVRPYDWRVGTRVECLWSGGTEWYAGHIADMGKDGYSLNVLYEDGDRERTKTGSCRSR